MKVCVSAAASSTLSSCTSLGDHHCTRCLYTECACAVLTVAAMLLDAPLQDLAWERYYDLKPSELGDLIRMPKYGKALVRSDCQVQTIDLQLLRACCMAGVACWMCCRDKSWHVAPSSLLCAMTTEQMHRLS